MFILQRVQYSDIVQIKPGKNTKLSDKSYSKETSKAMRLVKIELPSGEVEILITSLLDSAKYPDSIFKDLYLDLRQRGKRHNIKAITYEKH